MTDAHSQPAATAPEGLDDDELDRIESELARAERTLALLADDDIEPSAAAEWLTES
ncbi:hypothetical protein [Candidatus Poriferisodalis sp.]|uniref:hypothetical protein n=1 Tax=Candidatus Poriferisodalis sp. TaxID=3101277 RepID=UPI003D0D47C3